MHSTKSNYFFVPVIQNKISDMKNSIRTEIVINAPKEKVWEILTKFSDYQRWNPFMIKSEGKAIAGTKLKNTMKNGKGTITFKPVLLEVKPHESLRWLGSLFVKGIFDGMHYFHIEEVAPDQVNFVQGETFSGIFASTFFKKAGEQTRKNFVLMNQALKREAEKV